MAKTDERLSALKVASKLPAGMHADGKGLYLHVSSTGAKSWIFRYMFRGSAREMGLGSLSTLSLAGARAERDRYRALLKNEHKDPIETRKAEEAAAALEQAKATTFKQAAERFINSKRAGWRNAKHGSQWENTLKAYVYPTFGHLSVQDIDADLVRKVLEPIWRSKPETANRVRGRIESILDYAAVLKLRTGENPARWRGHLDHVFPAREKVRPVKHHAALPYAELPAFMAALREQEGVAARALEFTILTAARTGEAIGARRNEADIREKLWTVPAARMKASKEHRVPLSARAAAILREATELQAAEDAFIFPGGRKDKPLSNMAMTAVLRRMGRGDITVHGFRSTFRDWAAERTNYPNHVVEMALAHAVGDKVEAAYRRGDLFEKRRKLMGEWATYCSTASKTSTQGNIVPMRRKA